MGFLAPWMLLLGGAAVVPLLLHLLRRRVGMQVEFPAARYLARAEREHSRTMRMRNLLLMLLRVLTIVAIAAAAARPHARLGGGGHAPTALAIVIDNSLSSAVVQDGAPLLDTFKQLAHEVAAQATAEDRLWLVTADGAVRGGAAASILEEIERVRPLAGAGDPRAALAAAAALVSGSGMSATQVALLTDGQRTTWTEAAAGGVTAPVVAYVPDDTPPVNRAVTAAEPRPNRWTPRGSLAVRVLSGDSTTYRMAVGERSVARGTVAPGEESLVRAAPSERGWTAGSVEIEPDELPADNLRHFALWIGAPPAVRVSAGAGEFARNAVEVLRASQRVVDGAGIAVVSADEATARPALIVAPRDPVRIGAANRALERLGIPWRFGDAVRGASVARGADLPSLQVSLRYRLLPRGVPEGDTLATVGGDPWIVGGSGYVIIASPLVPEATTLPVIAAFIPWLTDVLTSRLHTDPGRVVQAAPGATLAIPSGAEALESAAGSRVALSGSTFEAPTSAGTYFFIQGTRRVGALVVNPEDRESRLERWSRDAFQDRIGASRARVLEDDAWVDAAFAGASRRPLVVPMLIGALLLLGLESLAAMARGRRVA